ncbi:MAG: hypothetical protein WC254_07205, partial [Candidatus Woesearchaeota archaeon]
MVGFFQFLKSLFEEKDVDVVIPKQSIAFAELSLWIETHTSQNAKSISDSSKPILDKIDDAIFANQANLSKLEHAELKNKDISSRELEIMKGNRQSYIKRTEQFLQQLSSLYNKEDITYGDIKKVSDFYTQEIQGYHSATLKPYAVLQHFFANESYIVAKNIKEIDELMKQLQAIIQKQSVEAITDIKTQIAAIELKLKQTKELSHEKKQVEEEYQKQEELSQQAQKKMNTIEESNGYQRYLQFVADAQEQQKKIEAHNAILVHSFSVIDKAVRKYAKTVPEKEQFLLSYIEKPVEALQADTSFEIAVILITIQQQLDALDIKDDKREKIQLELNILTRAFFEDYIIKYKKLIQEKAEKDMVCSSD